LILNLEEFITGPNCAQISQIGDRCYDQGLYEAAKLLYNNISNFGRLATTLVKLGQFQPAVDAARKANSIRSWKEVQTACLDAKETRLAHTCGLHIIIHGDELDEVVKNYESRGYFEELIKLLEAGILLDRAHVGMFTELSVLYSKYKTEKLMDYLRNNYNRINIPRVIRVCERNQQWHELSFLYVQYEEFDNAVQTMITHPEAFDHRDFKEVIVKVSNTDLFYRTIQFYLEEHPQDTKDLLHTIANRLDHERVVTLIRKLGHLAFIKDYLVTVQNNNVQAVNEALNELYIEDEEFEHLRVSIDQYEKFDHLSLAAQLERHSLLEFRRLAAYLYKKNNRFAQSIELSKRDKLYRDSIETAADSKDHTVIESLLRFFVAQENSECFAATLYTCYDYIKPDVALELGWRHKLLDFAMPYLIQVIREFTEKVDNITSKKKRKRSICRRNTKSTRCSTIFSSSSFYRSATWISSLLWTLSSWFLSSCPI